MRDDSGLARYAALASRSRGRRYAEPEPKFRSAYQRDRDRIIHATAFRRLVYKTQVFVNHEGDLYRTRLTHSLEVAQIGRTVARALAVNEDLVEAVSLAHDLGHTPFGHAGQDALNECMREHGGFEHNLQSLRVVDSLEQGYAAFPGLNLTFETREGILKHCSVKNARALGDIGQRFLERLQPSLEAQITDIADAVAYNNHDVDDGLRSGLIELEQLKTLPFFAEQLDATQRAFPDIPEARLHHEVIRRMIDLSVSDLVATSAANIAAAAPDDIEAVRRAGRPLIGFSPEYADAQRTLKAFLRDHLYTHARVRKMTSDAHATVARLFATFMSDYALMPEEHAYRARTADAEQGTAAGARVVADYIAGMTDRFALQTLKALDTGDRRVC